MEELLNFSVPEEEGGAVVRSPKNIARRKTGLRQTESFGLLNPDDELVSSFRKQFKKISRPFRYIHVRWCETFSGDSAESS